jgi:hypothetical protein
VNVEFRFLDFEYDINKVDHVILSDNFLFVIIITCSNR